MCIWSMVVSEAANVISAGVGSALKPDAAQPQRGAMPGSAQVAPVVSDGGQQLPGLRSRPFSGDDTEERNNLASTIMSERA